MKKIIRISVFALALALSLCASLAALLAGIIVTNELSILCGWCGAFTLLVVIVLGGGLGSGVAILCARGTSKIYDRFFA